MYFKETYLTKEKQLELLSMKINEIIKIIKCKRYCECIHECHYHSILNPSSSFDESSNECIHNQYND